MTILSATFNTSLLVESRLLVTLTQRPYGKFRFLELRKGLRFPLFSRIFNDPKLRIINMFFFSARLHLSRRQLHINRFLRRPQSSFSRLPW